jgi:O-antigen ligase
LKAPAKEGKSALLMCAMMLLVPALGVPNEELLQDTLKSILVCFFALGTALVFFWHARKFNKSVSLHAVIALPLLLTTYSLASMNWSHAYLAGVETIRWFIFTLIVFLGANTFTHNRLTHLSWGIHLGAVIASLWAALQFWFDFSFFAQGPNPASTFVNRNFFGEFLVCTLPFSVLLLTRMRDKVTVFFLTFSVAFNVVALMQTGTRSALIGSVILLAILPACLFRGKQQIYSGTWRLSQGLGLVLVFCSTLVLLGSIPTNNPSLLRESPDRTAIDRAIGRVASIAKQTEYTEGSFSVRAVMWIATAKMIQAHPIAGVGAGAWEVHIPIYQPPESQLETDYYAHNEFLQLVAEYGLIGCAFLVLLLGYLVWAACETWFNRTKNGQEETLLRALTLTSLFMLLLVSNAGFPWRMATTDALFALCLSILAASDVRLGIKHRWLWQQIGWTPSISIGAMACTVAASALAIFIAQQAIECESKIIRAVKISLTISQSGHPNAPHWKDKKEEAIKLVREGIGINPHYRKITPIVADTLASWGDWKNAAWIWESVIQSRPNVIAILANLTRTSLQTGELSIAENYLKRAQALRPDSPQLASLELELLSRSGKEHEAAAKAKSFLSKEVISPEVIKSSYYLGMRTRDPALAILALELRIKNWPEQAVDGWLKLGAIYDAPEAKNVGKAEECFRAALSAAAPEHKKAILNMIPTDYHKRIF